MYLGFYVGALANLGEIEDLLPPCLARRTRLPLSSSARASSSPVRTFLGTSALFQPPGLRAKFMRIWPFLLMADVLWALSPFLLLHHMNFGLALACAAILVYSPFAQRSLILMGAAGARPALPAGAD